MNKKIVIFFIVLAFILTGRLLLPVQDYELYKWNGLAYKKYHIPLINKEVKIKFTGKSIVYHSGTKMGMRTEIKYRYGFKHGDTVFYNTYPSSIGEITPYKYGKMDGTYKSYYANGNLKYEIEYKNGKVDGDYKEYYIDGSTLGIHYLYKDGKNIKTLKRDIDLFIGDFF